MYLRRRFSKSGIRAENLTELPKAKKSRVSGKKSSVPQDGVMESGGVFGQLLKTGGITLKAGERQNEIAVDGAIFQKKLHQALRKHSSYPQVVEEFITGLESHIENRDQFRNCLLPCVSVQNLETSNAVHSYCESLIKLLLGIEILQPAIIKLLFEKIPEFFDESVGSDGLNLPRLIVNQLKWLDRIVDSKELLSTIMQMISVSPPTIQHDIITGLPEILEDAQHSEIARELSSLLKVNTELMVPILDALSCLNLDLELLSEVCKSVMVTVAAVKVEDLPVVVKFILRSIKATNAVEVISDLRKKLDLDSCVSLPQIQASQSKFRNQSQASLPASQVSINLDCVKLLFEVIKSAVKFQKTILEGWIKAIENVSSASDHKVLDLIVLFVIYATSSKSKKQIERVLRSKIRLGYMREQFLQNAFRYHSLVMRDLFPAILSLSEIFVHSADPCIVSFGSCMYKQAFAAFDAYCQQEIVGALVTHACGGNSVEVDVSLDVLTDLVSLHTSLVVPYAVFLKSILDYMDNLSPQQIRKLFHILSVLAFSQGHRSSHIQDDMHMVIRKQLSSTIPKYKRIGIIGAVTMVGSMAEKRSRENGQIMERAQLSKEQCRQITSLLELVCSSCGQVPQALALYYDELANLIQKGNMDLQILDWIGSSVVKDFETDFVTDLVPIEDSAFLFPVKALYCLEEEESEATIAINLLPLLSQSQLNKHVDEVTAKSKEKRIVSPECLSPFFRLLRFCISELNNGNMEDIDALLVCPLYLTNLEVGGKLDSLSKQEREFLCTLLFHALNWFREVVNAFCQQNDAEIKGRVLARLQNITELQCLLEKILAASPGYAPPLANFDSDTLEGVPIINTAGTTKKKNKGKKSLKSDSSKTSSADNFLLEEDTESNQPESEASQLEKDSPEKESQTSLVQLQSYSAYFRELDLEVFNIFHSGLLTRSVLDTEMHTKTREIVQIGPAELLFLLEDLCHKLEHILIPTPAKRAPFLKGKGKRSVGFSHLCQRTSQEVIECAVELLKPLCNHMENMHNYFQALMAENQGMIDRPGVNVQEHQLMSSCYQHLLQVFHLLFAWSGFSQNENHSLLKSGLHVLADRLKPGEGEFSLEELLSYCFQYLLNFQDSIPNIYCALSLTQLLLVIAEKSVVNLKHKEIASITKHFLCQSWMQPNGIRQKGPQFNDALHTLFCIYMEHTDNILKAIEDISSIGIPELINSSKDGYSSTYPTLTRQTFPIFFRVMMAQLESSVRSISPGTPSDAKEVQLEKLLQWNMAVRDFHILVNLVKVFDSRPVLSVCLKYGRLFVETFLKHGMPLLDYSFKKHRDDVQSLLKTFQLSTRQLHHMCGHSKIHQDTGLTSHVPLLKKSLELFVYRVKAMLALNHCQEAFWLGVLKNRDLQGEEILSQVSQEDENVSMIAGEDPMKEQQEEEESENNSRTDPKDSDEDSSD
ncbi:Fanconi anemia group D2 protein isoform X2 [Sceloporus undulatus]|uniref:Fanconi anemia group D2 protein isoform X2 n=1 Tax=Sceloporus undulatus TaxID=8520 RepID=UPI001C4CC5B3|nr:Fanconi anemia group D2 protein isoform X2 [Sceloporus undulatus]XP_042305889.1 Fanconi anemia group D2 protein isoform X2 [Sceloporus undulatus]